MEIAAVPQVGERVRVAPVCFDLGGVAQPELGLADQIESDIGDRQVFLDGRTQPTQFRQAVPQDQAVVAQAQQVFEQRCVGCHHIFPSSSGIS